MKKCELIHVVVATYRVAAFTFATLAFVCFQKGIFTERLLFQVGYRSVGVAIQFSSYVGDRLEEFLLLKRTTVNSRNPK